jgi:predicted N-acyltransferase
MVRRNRSGSGTLLSLHASPLLATAEQWKARPRGWKYLAGGSFPGNLEWTVAETLELECGAGVSGMAPEEWDALVDPDDPFLEHGFLRALEKSGSVGGRSGWLPRFVFARQGQGGPLVGAVPLYLKAHSYGEFVFDWSWAAAAQRSGISYYPKLVAAAPFTPVTGPRLLVHPERQDDAARIRTALIQGMRQTARSTGASSIHVLFCREDEVAALAAEGFAARLGLQFHWRNREPAPYASFDDFLSAFRSRNRKQVRKERAVASSHGLELATRTGSELDDADWTALEDFYAANIDKHDGARYLTPAFFREIRASLAHRVVATLAYRDGLPVAGTLNFERGKHLYGRYWGCLEEREMLHFELCYYRLIERAIERGQTRFEAGAQGEHKLKRGLDPAPTHSAHLILHPGLHAAISRFVEAEAEAMERQIEEYRTLSPYSRAGAEAGVTKSDEPGSD